MSDDWKPVKCSPVRDAFFVISDAEQDKILRDLIASSASTVPEIDTGPTIISLQDTVDIIQKKFGDNWREYSSCVVTVIWASSNFTVEHVKEIVPDLFDLCFEYREKGTINGHEVPLNIFLMAFAVIDPNYPIEGLK